VRAEYGKTRITRIIIAKWNYNPPQQGLGGLDPDQSVLNEVERYCWQRVRIDWIALKNPGIPGRKCPIECCKQFWGRTPKAFWGKHLRNSKVNT